ncbi:hypothetical protein GMDG_07541, partial [Pseudogymnoascus destructans 20631-21]
MEAAIDMDICLGSLVSAIFGQVYSTGISAVSFSFSGSMFISSAAHNSGDDHTRSVFGIWFVYLFQICLFRPFLRSVFGSTLAASFQCFHIGVSVSVVLSVAADSMPALHKVSPASRQSLLFLFFSPIRFCLS